MRHATEEELVLQYFGEAPAEMEGHVEACTECRGRLAEIQRTLNVVSGYEAPERGAEYEAAVWGRVRTELGLKSKPRRGWQAWVAAAALATLVLAAFVAGRWYERPAVVAGRGERVLEYAMNEHLDRSQRVLMEISNGGGTEVSWAAEQLVAESRLYRQSVRSRREAVLLEELEAFLTEAAHAEPRELEALQKRLDESGLLFEVRATRARLVAGQRGRLPVDSF